MTKIKFDVNSAIRQGQKMLSAGQFEEAIAQANKIIEQYSSNFDAQEILAKAYLGQEQFDRGMEFLQKILSVQKKSRPLIQLYKDQFVRIFNAGQLKVLQQASLWMTRFDPNEGLAWDYLGISYIEQGQFSAAYEAELNAVALQPNNANVYCNLGNALISLDRHSEAIKVLLKALELDPLQFNAINNLGNAYRKIDKAQEAIDCYKRAIEISPGHAFVYNNLAVGYLANKEHELAIEVCQKALEIQPDFYEIYPAYIDALRDSGRQQEAIETCERIQEFCEDMPHFWGAYGHVLRQSAHINAAIEAYAKAIALSEDAESSYSRKMYTNLLFCLNYHPDMSAEMIFSAYKEFDERFCLKFRQQWRPFVNDRNPGRRLRVGYLSHVFYNQVCRYFLMPLLENHNHQNVEVFAYSNVQKHDEFTGHYKKMVDHWIDTNDLTDAELAERIRSDEIDILVDIAGHTTSNRLDVFARKPAPVSLHWLEYGYTTGLSSIDYYLTDQICAVGNPQHLFSEKLWPLEGSSFSYHPPDPVTELTPLPFLKNGVITFGTLSRAMRINYKVVRTWAAILDAMPNSRLVINSGDFSDPKIQDQMASRFVKLGIDRSRLDIGYTSPSFEVLKNVDISLDCFPHNSGTTLIESLYMGVPYVTMLDRPSVGRLGASILAASGHPEWIAQSELEYAQKALILAHDIEGLVRLRATLRGEMERSSIMDEPGFARSVENAYRQMWAIFCKENPI